MSLDQMQMSLSVITVHLEGAEEEERKQPEKVGFGDGPGS